jgi:hypothetical protein
VGSAHALARVACIRVIEGSMHFELELCPGQRQRPNRRGGFFRGKM